MPAIYGIMGGMEKTTVYLTSEQKAALARVAAAEGRSEARLIRAGIDAVTTGHLAAEVRAVLDAASVDRVGVPDPASRMAPEGARLRWVDRDAFVRAIVRSQADPGLGRELHELAPDTTDEARLR
jgi:hypothetical protein